MICCECGAQAWCVDSEGNVQERMFCYDCEAEEELFLEKELSSYYDDDYDAVSDKDAVLWGLSQEDKCFMPLYVSGPMATVSTFFDTCHERPYIFGIYKMRPKKHHIPF